MKTKTPLFLLWSYLVSEPLTFCAAVLSSFINKLADILPEVLIGVAIHIVTRNDSTVLSFLGVTGGVKKQLVILAGLTVIVWVLESIFQYIYMRLWGRIAQQTQHELRVRAYDHVQKLPMAYFGTMRTGKITTILNDDINQIALFLEGSESDGINGFLQLLFGTIMIGAIFFFVSPEIALVAFAPIPFVVGASLFFRRQIGAAYGRVRELASGLASTMSHNIAGILTIKSFLTLSHELDRVTAMSDGYRQENSHAIATKALFVPLVRMVVLSGFVYTLLRGGFMVIDGQIAISSYSMLIFLTQRMIWPFAHLATVIDSYEKSMASMSRISDIISAEIDAVHMEREGSVADSSGEGAITLCDVSFGYLEGQRILNEMSLTIPGKKTVAFVGQTGSGKSTIVKLLLRLFSAQSGSIVIDDVDISQVSITTLRSQVGYVGQESFLVPDTIAHNISYGKFESGQEVIERAAYDAQISSFIESLPEGYQTVLDEKGHMLSGGQRQRLAIARALARDPKILILDEATSALDNETEMALTRTLEGLQHSRTIIMVAHRLTTVRHADIIFALDRGSVAEQGTHDELLKKNGLYARLWKSQVGEL